MSQICLRGARVKRKRRSCSKVVVSASTASTMSIFIVAVAVMVVHRADSVFSA